MMQSRFEWPLHSLVNGNLRWPSGTFLCCVRRLGTFVVLCSQRHRLCSPLGRLLRSPFATWKASSFSVRHMDGFFVLRSPHGRLLRSPFATWTVFATAITNRNTSALHARRTAFCNRQYCVLPSPERSTASVERRSASIGDGRMK